VSESVTESPHLGDEEQEQAGRHAALSPLVMHEIIRIEGEEETSRDTDQLIWSGLAAGLSMGFSFFVQALIRARLPDAPWAGLIDPAGYMVGFVIVVLGRQQLFTESTLTAVLPVLTHRTIDSVWRTLRVWGWVLAANILGTWIFAAMMRYGAPFDQDIAPALESIAERTVSAPFGRTFLDAILAGWLIALMVWLLPSARSARILVVMLITYVVALARLSHIIAGSAEAAYAVLTGHADFLDYVWKFWLPTVMGNTIGGVVLVGLLNHAPVSSALQDDGRPVRSGGPDGRRFTEKRESRRARAGG
jgi:formate/nitrite transporter FocA (FNT family)